MTTKQKLVTKAEFSRIVGIDKSLVSKMSKSKLAKAMVGTRIDMAHASVKEYIKNHHAKKRKDAKQELAASERAETDTAPQQKRGSKGKKAGAGTDSQRKSRRAILKDEIMDGSREAPDDEELASFGDMKLKDILRRFGTKTQFKDLLSATKLIEDIVEKRIKNAKASGDLISRAHVHTFIFGAIEVMTIRLIQDSPRTTAAQVVAAWESGETLEQVEVIIRDLNSSQIRSMKKEIIKGMKSA